jgi:ribonuclease Z
MPGCWTHGALFPYEKGMGRLVHKELDGIKILGFSLAGEESVVAAPELNVCFDVGRAPREIISIDNICLTHGHMDHAAGIAYYLSQRGFVGNSPGRIIVHHSLVGPIQELMNVWESIEGHSSPGDLRGVKHLEDVTIRRGLIIRPFNVNHDRRSLGFTVIEVRHKLKDEYHGKSGPQLVELKSKGVEIEHEFEVPLLTFPGDTALGPFLDLDFVKRSHSVLLECTFFDAEHLSRARAGRHIHLQDLPVVLSAIPEAQIMLTHLSRRTDLRDAKRMLKQAIKPSDLQRMSFLMERPPRRVPRDSTGSTAPRSADASRTTDHAERV